MGCLPPRHPNGVKLQTRHRSATLPREVPPTVDPRVEARVSGPALACASVITSDAGESPVPPPLERIRADQSGPGRREWSRATTACRRARSGPVGVEASRYLMQARAFRALGPDSFENVRLYEGRATPSGPRCCAAWRLVAARRAVARVRRPELAWLPMASRPSRRRAEHGG